MSVIQGEVTDHKEVTGSLTVQGAVTGGATVRDGGHLRVDGHVEGGVRVERGGEATVRGSLTGVIFNSGVLFVAGLLAIDLRQNGGVLAVAPGTLIEGDPTSGVLQPDGSVHPLQGDSEQNLNIDASRYMRLGEDGRFVPL